MLAMKLIESAWAERASTTVFDLKQYETLRFPLEYSEINAVTTKCLYHILRANGYFGCIVEARIIATPDGNKSNMLIKVHEDSWE